MNKPKCVMCHKELKNMSIEISIGIYTENFFCTNPKCPNFTLLCVLEETIKDIK